MLLVAVLLTQGTAAFAEVEYPELNPERVVCGKSPLDTLIEKSSEAGFSLKDTTEFADLVTCGTFCDYDSPEELRSYLKEENGFSEFRPGSSYKPQPGDLLFYITKGKADKLVFTGIELKSVPERCRVVHVEYPEYEKLCWLYLRKDCSFSKAICCGIMANMYCESEFVPTAREETGQHGYGICQWTGERQAALERWCRLNGRDYDSLYSQLDFMKHELDSNEFEQLVRMMKNCTWDADGAYDVAHIFCLRYEDPYNSADVAETRGGVAEEAYWACYHKC